MSRVIVLASLNQDLVVMAPHVPAPGETILGTSLLTNRGGKGGNQVVALARLGVPVAVIGCVGADVNGSEYLDALRAEGVDVSPVAVADAEPTGVALITVADDGANSIVVVPGANGAVGQEHVAAARELIEGSVVALAQLEVPLDAVEALFAEARAAKVVTVLNPAPARDLGVLSEILARTDVLVPNEIEFEQIFGVAPLASDGIAAPDVLMTACEPAFDSGVKWVITTLGSKGAVVISPLGVDHVPAIAVEVTDTTAAGDSFVAGVVAVISESPDRLDADVVAKGCSLGTRVAALAVQRRGAQPSLPSIAEVEAAF